MPRMMISRGAVVKSRAAEVAGLVMMGRGAPVNSAEDTCDDSLS